MARFFQAMLGWKGQRILDLVAWFGYVWMLRTDSVELEDAFRNAGETTFLGGDKAKKSTALKNFVT